jgi:MADS-box transcription factor
MPTNTSLSGEAAKRPRLKVQIPSEQSDDGNSATAGSSPRGSAAGTPANKNPDAGHGSGVVLPPPSPSASAILSAGASGPPNPFARPLPPSGNSNSQSYNNNNSANQNNANQNNQNNNIETPMSALPSRFAESLLPSPSSFYPDWGFARSAGGNDSANMLPSPLNFSNQTPVGGHGSSFGREPDGGGEKRKSPDGSDKKDGGDAKRVKS